MLVSVFIGVLMLAILGALAAVGGTLSSIWRQNKKYDVPRILFDLKSGVLKEEDLENALHVSDVLDHLAHLRIDLKELADITPESAGRALDFHNRYTRGDKLQLREYLVALRLAAPVVIRLTSAPGAGPERAAIAEAFAAIRQLVGH